MLDILGIIFLLCVFVYWFYYRYRSEKFGAPFVPLEPQVVERVMLHAHLKPGKIFYDLGSGDGRIVVAAALRKAKAYGVEISTSRVIYSRLWLYILRLNDRAKIIKKDLFSVNLSDADVVCMYLLQRTNNKLKDKLEKELKKGTRVISVSFSFPGWKPKIVDPLGTKYGPIYVYDR